MLKLLLTLIVVVLGLMMWFGKGRARPTRAASPPATPPETPAQPIVACARCGVHLPRAELFLDDRGQPFCGAEHRRLGAVKRPRA